MNTKKDYCTQNDGDCNTCSLVNYGRDCKNQPLTATKVTTHKRGWEATMQAERKRDKSLKGGDKKLCLKYTI